MIEGIDFYGIGELTLFILKKNAQIYLEKLKGLNGDPNPSVRDVVSLLVGCF